MKAASTALTVLDHAGVQVEKSGDVQVCYKMAGLTENDRSDKALGLIERICRRDFMNSILIASGSTLLGSLSHSNPRTRRLDRATRPNRASRLLHQVPNGPAFL